MKSDQEKVFLAEEGDAYFRRNHLSEEHFDPARDPMVRLLDRFGVGPESVLEVGCATGFRLAHYQQRGAKRVVGVEPSEAAIETGRSRFPKIDLRQGVASSLPVKDDESFDLVIVNFVLHWVSRDKLVRSIAEIDRCLREGGLLALGDFSPDSAMKRPYNHRSDGSVSTWKYPYWQSFVATSLYRLVSVETTAFGAAGYQPSVESPNDRVFFALLEKTGERGYL